MEEVLLLLLGKGKAVWDPSKNYDLTNYFLLDSPNNKADTPFIVEALLKLHPKRFKKVHILGTQDALWDELHNYCTKGSDIEISTSLNEAVKNRNLTNGDPLLKSLEAAFFSYTNTECQCHIVELGTTDEELWRTFKVITSSNLDLAGRKISIDITHSLRFHTLFLVFALNYVQSVNPKTKFGSVFYGAFELKTAHNGLTPILNLTPFTEMMEWINAAQAFQRYGDPRFLADLLEPHNQPDLINKMLDFSNALQLNDVTLIRKTSIELTHMLHRLRSNLPSPLQLIVPSIQELPNKLQHVPTHWGTMVRVSRHHLNNNHIGLAVLAAWEAVIERFNDIYKPKDKQQAYKKLSEKARGGTLRDLVSSDFQEVIWKLAEFRNYIAHAGESRFKVSITDIARNFPSLLNTLETLLGDAKLQEMKDLDPWIE